MINFLSRLFKKKKNWYTIFSVKLEQQFLRGMLKKKIPAFHQIKYFGRFLNLREKIIVAVLLFIAVASLICLIVRIGFLCFKTVPVSGGQYKEGLIGQPKFINPILATNDIGLDLSSLIFSGFFKHNTNLELVPDLVANISSDAAKQHYTICLKQNVFWHDQQELTSEDALFTLNLAKTSDNPLLAKFKNLESIWLIDKNCFEFKLTNPSENFQNELTLKIIPRHIWQNYTLDNFPQQEFNLKPIGSGPFKFESFIKDKDGFIKSYTLAANNQFYGKIPYLEKIIFEFYPDFEQTVKALKIKEIDGLNYSPKEIKKELSVLKNLKHYALDLPYYTAIFLNLRKDVSTAKDKAIRQSLAYLTPKKRIFEEVLSKDGKIIYGPLLPYSLGSDAQIEKYDYNPIKAQEILIKNGWEKGASGFFEKGGQIFEISLTTVDQPDLLKVAQIIQKAWQDIGLKIKLIVLPPDAIDEVIQTRNFECLLYGILENINSDPYPIWHSSQIQPPGLNLTGFSNRRADELLEKAKLIKDKNTQETYWLEFQKIIAENAPAIFLYNTSYSYFVDKKIKGIDVTRIFQPHDRFIDIENWYIKMRRTFR